MTVDSSLHPGRAFAIAHGPFLRVLHRVHLTRADGTPRAWALVAIAWGPLWFAALVELARGHLPAPMMFDISVHTRLLIGIPLLIHAGRLLERRCRSALEQLYDGNFADNTELDRIMRSAERMRTSRVAELVILAIALALGQAVLWREGGATGLVAGVRDANNNISFSRAWYGLVSLPVLQFLAMRWMWQWLIWNYIVVRVARLPLATISTHPDHAAGIGFMASPVAAFAGFVFAVSTMISSAWGTQLLDHEAKLQHFIPPFIVYIGIIALVACGPLCAYIGILYRARHRDVHHYNDLSLECVRAFDAKFVQRTPDTVLGAPAVGTLHDMLGAYEHLEQVRLVPFERRALFALFSCAIIPMLPLIATTMSLTQLVGKVGDALLGHLP